MEKIDEVTYEILNKIAENNKEYSRMELMTLDSLKKVRNPFLMLTVKDVMKDLNISE